MRHIAIIGSGPAGYYTAEAAQKAFGDTVKVDIFDRLPVPFGLIRTGVAPDHQSIKAVANRYEKTALSDNVRFVGNVTLGESVTVNELRGLYDAVILATGAPKDRELGIPGENLGNVFGSAEFVGWYNGHPQFTNLAPDLSGKTAVVIGVGNVALDVARILAKTEDEFSGSDIVAQALSALKDKAIKRIVILGRRGPHQIQMTPKELGELGHLVEATPVVNTSDLPPVEADEALEPGLRKSVTHLRSFAAQGAETGDTAKPVTIEFAFYSSPKALLGKATVEAIEIEKTALIDGELRPTGEVETLPCDLVVSCIGYRSVPIPGVPFDERAGRFSSDEGRIEPGLYCVGWARRGPSGTIGTNKPDGFAIIDRFSEDLTAGLLGKDTKQGRAGFDALAEERGLDIVTFRDWKKIEEAEIAAARDGAPREKFTDIEAMMKARG